MAFIDPTTGPLGKTSGFSFHFFRRLSTPVRIYSSLQPKSNFSSLSAISKYNNNAMNCISQFDVNYTANEFRLLHALRPIASAVAEKNLYGIHSVAQYGVVKGRR